MNPIRKHAKSRAVVVDYPQSHEIILGERYSFRIQAGEPGRVEVAVDGRDWKYCREAVGYWWFDWNCTPGDHTLSARLVREDGSFAEASTRRFTVGLPSKIAALQN